MSNRNNASVPRRLAEIVDYRQSKDTSSSRHSFISFSPCLLMPYFYSTSVADTYLLYARRFLFLMCSYPFCSTVAGFASCLEGNTLYPAFFISGMQCSLMGEPRI